MNPRKISASSSSLKIPYADLNGELVHISQVERGLACECVCIECGGILVARKGEKTRHHFAHHTLNRNCDGESLLHKLGKHLLAARVEFAIANGEPLPITWECERCYRKHEGDLVQGVECVKIEHAIDVENGRIIPDVMLVSQLGKPQTFVEIIVTHEPEKPVYDYAKANNVAVVELRLKSEDDLDFFDKEGRLNPHKATLPCLTPACQKCNNPLLDEPILYFLYVVTAPCWKCHEGMKLALWEVVSGGLTEHLGPYIFGPSGRIIGMFIEEGDGPSEGELTLARKHGAVIKRQGSQTMGTSYMANTCIQCGAFVGANYEADYGEFINSSNRVAAYYACEHCGCGTCDCKSRSTEKAEREWEETNRANHTVNTSSDHRSSYYPDDPDKSLNVQQHDKLLQRQQARKEESNRRVTQDADEWTDFNRWFQERLAANNDGSKDED